MQLQDLQLTVQAEIGLGSSGQELTLTNFWINRGVVDVLRKTRCYIVPATMTLTANQSDYLLPNASILEIVMMDLTSQQTGVTWSLERTTLAEIRRRKALAQTVSGLAPLYFAVVGASLFTLFPTPGAADTINVYYIPRPTKMSGSTDDPSTSTFGGIPEDYHDAIELYALYRAARYDDDISSNSGQSYFQEYQRRVREIRREIQRMGTGRAPKIRVGRARGRRNLGFPPGYDIGN